LKFFSGLNHINGSRPEWHELKSDAADGMNQAEALAVVEERERGGD
jgi:hypothetical protein